jgi:hypothetical protein
MSICVCALVDEEITEHMKLTDNGYARAWLATMISTLNNDDQVKLFVTLWAIWNARWKAVHEQVYQSPLSVHFFVENFIVDLRHGEEQVKRNWAVSTVQMS